MKKTMIAMLVLILLNGYVPGVRAEISQELDPMVPVDFQATVTKEAPASSATAGQTSKEVSAATADEKKAEKKVEKPKKKKTKKSSLKKSSSKKNDKLSSKKSKESKDNSR